MATRRRAAGHRPPVLFIYRYTSYVYIKLISKMLPVIFNPIFNRQIFSARTHEGLNYFLSLTLKSSHNLKYQQRKKINIVVIALLSSLIKDRSTSLNKQYIRRSIYDNIYDVLRTVCKMLSCWN